MKKLLNKDAWMEPNGKLHEVASCCHLEFAESYLKKELGDDYKNQVWGSNPSPTEVLSSRGWVRIEIVSYEPEVQILGNCIDLCQPMRNTMEPAMNQTQIRIAKQICEEYGTTLHKAINDKRFW